VRLPGLLTILLLGGQAAPAQEMEVVSPQADSVSITIYRDLFALVTETRTVDLPEGPVTLSFEGVVETLLPQSAVVTDTGRALAERNFDYDPLTPNNLLTRSIGKSVTITRTLPGAGRVVQTRAVIVAANDDGITLRTEQGNEALHCSGIPERLAFDEIPGDLHARPKLSVRLAAGPAGKRTVRVSYLAHGFAWKSDYVARLNGAGNRMQLTGWLTLRNYTRANLRAAQVQVVAGKLHLVSTESGGSSLAGDSDNYYGEDHMQSARDVALTKLEADLAARDNQAQLFSGCHASPAPPGRVEGPLPDESIAEAIVVTGYRMSLRSSMEVKRNAVLAEREELGDYKLYRLPWATDLNARQAKQAVFLVKPRVKVDRFYRYIFDATEFRHIESFIPELIVAFENRKSSGLGEPLPSGVVRVFETSEAGDLFAGESQISDKPVRLPVELNLAMGRDLAMDITVNSATTDELDASNLEARADVRLRALNAKGVPVTIEVRQENDRYHPNAKIVKSNRRVGRKFGDFAWRLRVPANDAETLTYRIDMPKEADPSE
jgi:hypothetical protein